MRSNIARTCHRLERPVVRRLAERAWTERYFSCERKLTTALNFCGGRFLNDGIGAVGFTSVRAIPWRGSREAMCVRSRTGPVVAVVADLVARQAARLGDHLLAGFVFGERRWPPACHDGVRRGHFDRRRRAGVGARVGQEGHRADHGDAGQRRDRAALGAALGTAVVERQQEQQDHAERRHADRGQRHEARRLDHAQNLEQEEEVPLGTRHVGGGRRVGLRAELGAEHQRHRDDRPPSPRTPSPRPWPPRRGRTACPGPSGSRTRGGTPPSRAGSSR